MTPEVIKHNKKEFEKWFKVCPLCYNTTTANNLLKSNRQCKNCNYSILDYENIDAIWLYFPYGITICFIGQRSISDCRNICSNILDRGVDIYYKGNFIIQDNEYIFVDVLQLFEKTKKRMVFA